MNKVILMGRLTRDPDIRYSNNSNGQMAIARFSLAVDRRFKRAGDSVDADFFNCTAFGKQAEFVERYLKQGTKILMSGRIQNDNYTNKEGQKVYSVQVIAEEIESAESKNASAANAGGYNAPAGRPAPSQAGAVSDGFLDIPDGVGGQDLPFY